MLDHLAIQCRDVAASATFYDAVLAPIGGARVLEYEQVIGYGAGGKPDFWIGPRATGALHPSSRVAGVPPELLRRVRA